MGSITGRLINLHCFLLQEPSGVVIQILQRHTLIWVEKKMWTNAVALMIYVLLRCDLTEHATTSLMKISIPSKL
jgi:hypothetical protein